MNFKTFLGLQSKIHNLPLPGREVQLEMAPMERIKSLKRMDIDALNPRQAAVMAVFYPDRRGDTHFVLILRKTYKGVHSNQVGFPGGKVEKEDLSLEYTALRETQEEVGISIETVHVVKKMTNIYIPPSNFWVQSYMGYLDSTPKMTPQESEVADIIEVALSDLLRMDSQIKRPMTTSYMKNKEVPAFKLNGHIVWGATAMILNEVRSLVLDAVQR